MATAQRVHSQPGLPQHWADGSRTNSRLTTHILPATTPPHSHPQVPGTETQSQPDGAKPGSGSGCPEHHQAELERWKLTSSWEHTQKNAAVQVLGR